MNFDVFFDEEVAFDEPKFKQFLGRDPVAKTLSNVFAGKRRGFCGLSLSLVKALWLVKCLRKLGVDVYVTRHESRPEMEMSLLLRSAEDEFLERMKRFPGYDFFDAEYVPLRGALSIRAAQFRRHSKKMANEGFTPPGIFVYVDRYDSHILSSEELLDIELLDELSRS